MSESRYQIRPDQARQVWELRRLAQVSADGILVHSFPTQAAALALWETLSARLQRADVPCMATLFDAEGNAVRELRPTHD